MFSVGCWLMIGNDQLQPADCLPTRKTIARLLNLVPQWSKTITCPVMVGADQRYRWNKQKYWFHRVEFYISWFYQGYCKGQRNAAVIILRYTMLCHNWLWKLIHIYPFDTIWRNSCVWRSKPCQLHVDFTFRT